MAEPGTQVAEGAPAAPAPAAAPASNLGLFSTPQATPAAAEGAAAPTDSPESGNGVTEAGGSAPASTEGGGTAPGGPLLASLLQDAGLKENASISRYQSPDALATAYLDLEKKIGEKGLILPGETATAEERMAFYKQLPGFPEEPAGYGVTEEVLATVLPQGALAPSGEALTGLQQAAHEAGITAPQLGAVLTWYGQWMSSEVEANVQSVQQQAVAQRDALTQMWGANTDRNLVIAKEQVRRMFGDNPAFLSAMLPGGDDEAVPTQVGTSPEIARIFYELAQYTGTDSFVQFGSTGLLTPQQADEKIQTARTQQANGEITMAQLTQIIEQYQPLASEAQ